MNARRLFLPVAGAVFLAFAAGLAFGVADLPPVPQLREHLRLIRGASATSDAHGLTLAKRHEGAGLVRLREGRASPGLTLLQLTEKGGHVLRLVDLAGATVREWPLDWHAHWDEAPHVDPPERLPSDYRGYHVQGFEMEPDGSVVAVFSHLGAVRYDRCGGVLWRLDRLVHHAVTGDGAGGYWFPDRVQPEDVPARWLPWGKTADDLRRAIIREGDGMLNAVTRVDAEGRVLATHPILPALEAAGFYGAIDAGLSARWWDPLHLNDIEIVDAALAGRLAGVEAGDLLLSMRTPSLLAIVDDETGAARWSARGAWVQQHDPDVEPGGTIVLFNNMSLADGPYVPEAEAESTILALEPDTLAERVVHPPAGAAPFRSDIMGTHQRLANGNRLIAETRRGRAFEATPEGEVVWSYVVPFDDRRAGLVYEAERFAPGYFDEDPRTWRCD